MTRSNDEDSRDFVDLLSDLTLLGVIQTQLSVALEVIEQLPADIQDELKDMTEALTTMTDSQESDWARASQRVLKEILCRALLPGETSDEN